MIVKMKPIESTFKLKADEDGEAVIVVNQAREDENIKRQEMFSTITRIYNTDPENADQEVRVETEQNMRRIRRYEAYLTLASVAGVFGEDGEELFRNQVSPNGTFVRRAMSEDEFNKAWGLLPVKALLEIVGYVLEVNPMWRNDSTGE